MEKHIDFLNSLLQTAGETFKLKHSQGVNLSVYRKSNGKEPGLMKIDGLAYRGDGYLPNRSGKEFYSLEHDNAVILDCLREESSIWKNLHPHEVEPQQSRIAWVYAMPIIESDGVTGVVCFTGSNPQDCNELSDYRKDIETMGKHLRASVSKYFACFK